ncbi:hypothetical protein BDP81DRAFT_446443 [Colletotrichum phormii]|uniref:Uncharacterized protein n=1 Tax=Colletotrichum phormii TaxID=359342 RepID=A0AAI9ZXI7_9PEZI|nr:uncharacterized protein BDP81DRAFT_446443 [Colletotrichum phormii]KAK1640055.1 hypothetical protein BDP81DRAFT_446443 [Colletotrichum phormii]
MPMDFHIDREYPHRTFAVTGFLSDSVGSAQWSEYIGESPRSIMAVGVADSSKSTRRFISIAAGEDYEALNATQCTIDFVATLFNVSVDLKDRSILVVPSKSIEDFDPRRYLTRAIIRQFDSISNSLQSFHGSVLGDVIVGITYDSYVIPHCGLEELP